MYVFFSFFFKHLLPESLNGKTVKFSSKKLINTRTRSEIEIALKTHGVLEASYFKLYFS